MSQRIAALLLLALTAHLPAYELTGYEWPMRLVEYRINPNFPEPSRVGTPDDQIALLRCAADAWRGQTRTRFNFRYAGTSSRNRLDVNNPGNALFYAEADGQAAVAATLIRGDTATGRAEAFDVIFFATSFNDPNVFRGVGEPGPGEFDLGGVATHELGHVLGLGHTPERDATMYPEILVRALELRTLHADDREGAETIYGLRQESLPPVVIDVVTPAMGHWTGGNEVVITGDNFTYTSDTRIFLDDAELPREHWQVESCSRIRIPALPAHAPGVVDVQVVNTVGADTRSQAYRFTNSGARLLGVEPSEGPIGGGTPVTVTGESFTAFDTVLVGDVPLRDAVVDSPTRIVGTLPPGSAPGPVDVRLLQGGEELVLRGAVTYNPYVIEGPMAGARPGETDVDLLFAATTPEPLAAASFGVTFPGAQLTLASLSVEGTAASLAEQVVVDIDNAAGWATVSIILDVDSDTLRFPAGTARPLARASATVAPGAAVGTLMPIAIVGTAGEPLVPLQVRRASDGAAVRPFPIAGSLEVVAERRFRRADANGDQEVNITDAVFHLDFLFQGGAPGPCADAADANDDGRLDLSDAVTILRFLFQGDTAIPPPSPNAGLDPTDDGLGCGA